MLVAGLVVASVWADTPAACSQQKVSQEAGGKYVLKANSSTVHWGYFFSSLKPTLVVPSGSEVTVEMITHHGTTVLNFTNAVVDTLWSAVLQHPK